MVRSHLLRYCPRRSIKGFLLFEAMVAVAIASLALVLITRGFSSSLRAAQSSEDHWIGAWIAEERMFELESEFKRTRDTLLLNDRGRFSAPFEEYTWSVESEPMDDLSVQSVHLTVTWRSGKREEDIILETYLFQPEETRVLSDA